VSYQVGQRRTELGIRMALGASRSSVLGLVVGQGLRLAVLGAAIGLALALLSARAMRSMLYGIGPLDLPTYAAVVLLLVSIALAASAVPAWRASRTDPQLALRAE
jgi:ABC-type antimicrobial peptide transport system permease subunit